MARHTNSGRTSESAAIRELVRKAMILAQIKRVRQEVDQLEKLVNAK